MLHMQHFILFQDFIHIIIYFFHAPKSQNRRCWLVWCFFLTWQWRHIGGGGWGPCSGPAGPDKWWWLRVWTGPVPCRSVALHSVSNTHTRTRLHDLGTNQLLVPMWSVKNLRWQKPTYICSIHNKRPAVTVKTWSHTPCYFARSVECFQWKWQWRHKLVWSLYLLTIRLQLAVKMLSNVMLSLVILHWVKASTSRYHQHVNVSESSIKQNNCLCIKAVNVRVRVCLCPGRFQVQRVGDYDTYGDIFRFTVDKSLCYAKLC